MLTRSLSRVFAVALTISVSCSVWAAGSTVDALVSIDGEKSLLWKTATSSPARLALDWPEGAVRAELSVVARPGGTAVRYPIADTSLAAYDYVFALPTKAADERVETLTLTYFDAQDAVVASFTARLGVVLGVANGATVPCRVRGTDSPRWAKGPLDPVVPIPEDSANLRQDGAVVAATPDTPGWWQLGMDAGMHAVTLNIDGEDVERTVNATGDGQLLIIR